MCLPLHSALLFQPTMFVCLFVSVEVLMIILEMKELTFCCLFFQCNMHVYMCVFMCVSMCVFCLTLCAMLP